jgi:hypothetical protein
LPSSTKYLFRAISDGCFFSGVFFISFGVLGAISNSGLFDSTNYAFRRMFNALFHPKKYDKSFKSYYDWVMSKERDKGQKFTFLFVTGAIFLVAATIALFLFYR